MCGIRQVVFESAGLTIFDQDRNVWTLQESKTSFKYCNTGFDDWVNMSVYVSGAIQKIKIGSVQTLMLVSVNRSYELWSCAENSQSAQHLEYAVSQSTLLAASGDTLYILLYKINGNKTIFALQNGNQNKVLNYSFVGEINRIAATTDAVMIYYAADTTSHGREDYIVTTYMNCSQVQEQSQNVSIPEN